MSNPIDDIKSMLDAIGNRKDELAKFEGLLSEVAVAMQDIVSLMERPDEDAGLAAALVAGLKSLTFPAPTVQVAAAAAPDVHVTVQPAQVVVMPAAESAGPIKGWNLTVTSHDGNGRIRSLSFKPEN